MVYFSFFYMYTYSVLHVVFPFFSIQIAKSWQHHTHTHHTRLSSEREVVVFCDLHGHSRKQNVFIYGCDDMENKSTRFKSRVFPKMLCKNTPTMFSYRSSKFGIHKSKVQFYYDFPIVSLTLCNHSQRFSCLLYVCCWDLLFLDAVAPISSRDVVH